MFSGVLDFDFVWKSCYGNINLFRFETLEGRTHQDEKVYSVEKSSHPGDVTGSMAPVGDVGIRETDESNINVSWHGMNIPWLAGCQVVPVRWAGYQVVPVRWEG